MKFPGYLEYYDEVTKELFGPELKAKAEADDKAAEESEKLRISVLNLINDEDGKRFMWAMLNETGVFRDCFTGNSETFYREGKRSVGLYVYQLLMAADPMALQKLVNFRRENLKEKKDG